MEDHLSIDISMSNFLSISNIIGYNLTQSNYVFNMSVRVPIEIIENSFFLCIPYHNYSICLTSSFTLGFVTTMALKDSSPETAT